ncbi:MAG: hypothetical protein JEZ04_04900 [Spirochaetales bacterium]|nr:hypothetical protein [Spirochaetales bacterium]
MRLAEISEEPLPDDIFSEQVQWKPDVNALSARFKLFSHGIEVPAEIFSASIKFLQIESGIFLTYEKSTGLFSPFSSIGFDETSLRRCKISMETIKANKIVLNGETIHPSVPKGFLKNHLSKRLWDSINLLSVLVFSHHDDIFGLLFIINSTITETPGFTDSASLLIRNASEALFNSRSAVISNLETTEIGPPLNPKEAAVKIKMELMEISKSTTTSDSARLVFIDYSSIISSMKDFDSSIDDYVIERNIFKMYYSMLGGKGYIQRLSKHCIFLTFLSRFKVNTSIITNQLQASLLSLFEKNKLIGNPKIFVDEINLNEKDFPDKLDLFLSSVL